MGLFSTSQSSVPTGWNEIENIADLEKIKTLSEEKVQYIFKHSTRCSISSFALRNVVDRVDTKAIAIHYLDLIAHRDISAAIAEQFDVEHQSPQLIKIQNGKAAANCSHESITEFEF